MLRALQRISVLPLLWLNVASGQYAELRPLMEAAKPVVKAQGQVSTSVQLGPVNMTFPAKWQFYPDTVGTKAISPSGAVVTIMVLDHPGGRAASLPDARASLPKALSFFCESGSSANVDQIESTTDRQTYVGSCTFDKGTEDSPYTLIHEVRYPGRIVQVIHSGTRGVAAARVRQDAIAKSIATE